MYANFLPKTSKPYPTLVTISPDTKIGVYATIRALQNSPYCNLTAIPHINSFFRPRFSASALIPDLASM
jgi:hypothetical protein